MSPPPSTLSPHHPPHSCGRGLHPRPRSPPGSLPASTATSSRSRRRRRPGARPCSSCNSRAGSCRRWVPAAAVDLRPPPRRPTAPLTAALATGPGGDGALPKPGAGPRAEAAAAMAGADPQDEGRVPGPQPVQRELHAQVPHRRGLVCHTRPARPAAGSAGQLGEWGWGASPPPHCQAGASPHNTLPIPRAMGVLPFPGLTLLQGVLQDDSGPASPLPTPTSP